MQKKYKIIVTVPAEHTERIISAMADAGAGNVGNYSHCAIITKVTGTFLPSDGAKPFTGQVNKLNLEPEDRIEMICSQADLEKVIAAILKNHPYENPTIDAIESLFFTK